MPRRSTVSTRSSPRIPRKRKAAAALEDSRPALINYREESSENDSEREVGNKEEADSDSSLSELSDSSPSATKTSQGSRTSRTRAPNPRQPTRNSSSASSANPSPSPLPPPKRNSRSSEAPARNNPSPSSSTAQPIKTSISSQTKQKDGKSTKGKSKKSKSSQVEKITAIASRFVGREGDWIVQKNYDPAPVTSPGLDSNEIPPSKTQNSTYSIPRPRGPISFRSCTSTGAAPPMNKAYSRLSIH